MARRRTKKTLKERVNKYLVEWADFLGLSQTWEINFQFVDEIEGETAGGHEAGAVIAIFFPYQRAEIQILKALDNHTDYDIERSILHELTHIPLSFTLAYLKTAASQEVYDVVWGQMETVADVFTRLLLRQKYEVKR
jgi:hypothetical protein